uniref:Uncharacterized protein n=1 Tax=Saimiri boliviensis boliviensis TaxID=39432 RepID=A0A2K6U3L3_SAIBB
MDSLAAGELNAMSGEPDHKFVAYWRKTTSSLACPLAAYATLCPLAKQAQVKLHSVPTQQSYRGPQAPSFSLLLCRCHAAKQTCRNTT